MPYVTERNYAELLRSDYQNSELRARIEALTAERDAAITEGEARATAAIVADLRGMEWGKPVPLEIATRLIADHIEQKFGKPPHD